MERAIQENATIERANEVGNKLLFAEAVAVQVGFSGLVIPTGRQRFAAKDVL